MYSYQLQRRQRAQHIKIKIDLTGQIIVVASADCPTHFIDRFVQQQHDWIEKNLAKVKAVRAQRPVIDENVVQVFGQQYQREVVTGPHAKLGVRVEGEKILITPVSSTKASVEKALEGFFKSTAEKYIVPRTHQLAKVMGIGFGSITMRAQKTRWGSCSSQGNLNFNWRLVHSPPPVIDYVIIHELAHRKHMNHSARFWELVRQYDPEYLKHRGWLKRQGMALG